MEHDYELEAALNEGLDDKPLTLEQVRAASDLAAQSQRERVARIRRDGSARPDVFDVEQTIAQTRAASHATRTGQVFDAAGHPLNKTEPETSVDPLLRALEDEVEPAIGDLGFESVPAGRVTIPMGPGLVRAASTDRHPVTDLPIPEILARVAERMTAGSAPHAFARMLEDRAREEAS